MKIKPEHLAYLKEHVKVLNPERYVNAGLTSKRYLFDCLYATEGMSSWICDNLYSYMNDTHIYTALRSLIDTGMFPKED